MRVKYPTPGYLPNPTKPFGSINVEKRDDSNEIRVTAQVLMDRLVDEDGNDIEGIEFGLAIDGSRSMNEMYGEAGPFKVKPNLVAQVVVKMVEFLGGYSANGDVELAFWAVGAGGKEIEEVGKVTPTTNGLDKIRPQKTMGGSTYLLPIVKHFVDDKLKDANWAMAVIITDGKIDDMPEVEDFTDQYAVEVDKGKRKLIKLVLLGLGEHVDVSQLERLDNFDASVDVDIWSSNVASEMEHLYEIFSEVMSDNLIVANSAKVIDDKGQELIAFNDGLSAKFEFNLKAGSTGFRLEIPDQSPIEQDLSEALALLK